MAWQCIVCVRLPVIHPPTATPNWLAFDSFNLLSNCSHISLCQHNQQKKQHQRTSDKHPVCKCACTYLHIQNKYVYTYLLCGVFVQNAFNSTFHISHLLTWSYCVLLLSQYAMLCAGCRFFILHLNDVTPQSTGGPYSHLIPATTCGFHHFHSMSFSKQESKRERLRVQSH